MDWIGYTTGKPTAPAPALAGIRGALDFIGYPIGQGAAVAPPIVYKPRGGAHPTKKRKQADDEDLLLLS